MACTADMHGYPRIQFVSPQNNVVAKSSGFVWYRQWVQCHLTDKCNVVRYQSTYQSGESWPHVSGVCFCWCVCDDIHSSTDNDEEWWINLRLHTTLKTTTKKHNTEIKQNAKLQIDLQFVGRHQAAVLGGQDGQMLRLPHCNHTCIVQTKRKANLIRCECLLVCGRGGDSSLISGGTTLNGF